MRHRFRAVAAVFAGAMCVALTTGVQVIAVSVDEAIKGAPLSSVAKADWTVQARSSSGMSLAALAAMRAAVPNASLAPVILANTRISTSNGAPFVLAGTTPRVRSFLPAQERSALDALSGSGSSTAVVLSRGWARDHHLSVGSGLALDSPSGRTVWRVAALMPGATANGGALAVAALPAVARAFQREGVADLVLASAPGSHQRLRSALQRAAGPSATVVAPDQSFASYQKAFAPTRNLLNIFVAVAVLAAGAILYFCWRLALEDAREQLARLRLCGARMRDLALGATAVMGGIFLLSVLIGGPLGILLGASLSGFARTLVALTQLAASPGVPIVEPLIQAVGTSFLIFAFALGTSLLTIRRMPVIEAVVGRREVHRVGATRWRVTGGVAIAALVIGVVSLTTLPQDKRQLGLVPFLVLLGALSIATPTLMGAAIRRLPTFSALGTGRELAFNARRTATLLYVFALAIAMAIALQGAATSLQDGIAGGVRAWTGDYLFVQPAQSGANLQDDKFASGVGARLGRIPGVSNVGYFTYSTIELHATRVPLWTWGPNQSVRYADMRSTQGPSGGALWQALGSNTVAISSNYARLYGTKMGDRILVPAVNGQRALRVVAIVEDLTTTAGMLLVAPQLYTTLTNDQRAYEEILGLAPTASVAAVRRNISTALGSRYPSIAVYDQRQIRDRFNALTSQLVQAFVVFGRIMFVLALLIGGATLATSMSLRQRSFALTRLVGAPVLLLRQQLRREALALGTAAWLIAAPVGVALVYALVAAIAAQSGLLPRVELPVALVILSLPLAVGMSVLSLFIAAPRSRMPVTVVALAEE